MSVLEAKGIPTATVCTTRFAYEAAEQWRALGYRDHAVVEVRHPFGHLGSDAVIADGARVLPDVARLLTTVGGKDAADAAT
ncbi:MAG: hypothetical protein GEU93_06785 [Propionibacteriales bacterium]|nr:hypothetical protein [Propionibacteriales bacterium]